MSGTPRPGAPSLTARVALSCIVILLAWAAPAAAVDLDPSDDPLAGQLVPGRRRQPEADEAVHRLGDVPERRARRARARPERRGQRVQGREQGGRARGLGPDDGGGRGQPRQGQHPRRLGRGRPARRPDVRLSRLRAREGGGDDVRHLRAQPRLAAVEQRQRADPLPADRRPPDLVRAARQRDASVVVSRWKTTATDPDTSCATKGTLTDATGLKDGVDVQGAPNAGDISTYLPGAYESTIPEGRFGETGIDLAKVLADAFGDDCLAYASVWMHSRSSTSESSNMQDYVAPQPIDARTCAAAGTKFFDRNANGQRDTGEPGLPRFEIFADYDGDGVLDAGEPFDRHRQRRALRARRHPAARRQLRRCASSSCTPARATGAARTPARSPPGRSAAATADRRRRRALRARPRLRELVPGPVDRAQGARPTGRSRPLRPAGERRGVRPRRR